jgi:asparaginyl-tRNA synthetase
VEIFCQKDLLLDINFGSWISLKGNLKMTPDRSQPFELVVSEIKSLNSVKDPDYPLQKKEMTLKEIRNYPQIRPKTNYFLSVFRLRDGVSRAIHDFFSKKDFYYVTTPIITDSDSEGAGEMFEISSSEEKYFSNISKLTVSGQLQAEALSQGLGKVYTFSPCFRAEKSNTTRHLAEFWMIEPEMSNYDLDETMNLSESLLKFVIASITKNNIDDLNFFEEREKKITKETLTEKLERIISKDFVRITYEESLSILKDNKENFSCKEIF